MTVDIRKTCDESSIDHDAVEELMAALRRPHTVFGSAADPDVFARCEMADWDAISAALKSALDQYDVSATDVLAMLRLAGEFMRHHEIYLDGYPWVCTQRDEEGFWVCYRIHTSLGYRHLVTWEDRFDDLLDSRGIDLEGFRLQFASAGPR
ncbi:hypothetical protein [Roseateles chitinivorans]|uniref:hypothetical protein n=1 Tax=Roseateles chitinivorans TaxID=2917965 RepID=UPI003D66A73C